jgi:hypothetical protein
MISLCDLAGSGRLWGQVGIDRPDDADVPSDEYSDRPADRSDATDDRNQRADRPSGAQIETRYRQEYEAELRSAASADDQQEIAEVEERSEAGRFEEETSGADERVDGEPWDETAERSRGMWADYQRGRPSEERPPVDRSGDPPGSWRGDSNRFLDSAANGYVNERCDRIAETEWDVVSPAMRAVESRDPDRPLIGFEYRLKGRDRIKDKVAEQMEAQPDLTVDQAVATVKDAVRYTFCYSEERYSTGVRADIDNMAAHGFQEVEHRNSWKADQYKGINSRWREPGTGLIFEVQFHTRSSFEAKQITHGAYERLRDPRTTSAEQRELEGFQGYVCARIPIPPDAVEIPDYP